MKISTLTKTMKMNGKRATKLSKLKRRRDSKNSFRASLLLLNLYQQALLISLVVRAQLDPSWKVHARLDRIYFRIFLQSTLQLRKNLRRNRRKREMRPKSQKKKKM